MLSLTQQFEISDFLVNIKSFLKQRIRPIRILKQVELDRQGFYDKLHEILERLEIYDSVDFIDTKPNDFDLYEEIVNRFCNDYFVGLGDLDISDLKMNLMNYGSNTDHLIDRINKHYLTANDGTVLNVYSYGSRDKNPIIVVLPTGMPMLIMRSWIEILANDYFVITWETRGMFNLPDNNKKIDLNIEAQLADLELIINYFDFEKVHIFGVCHGANLALHACHAFSSKIFSASLWHGDFNWNDDSKLTFIQRNMKRLLEAAEEEDDIPVLRGMMSNPKSINRLTDDYPIKMLPHIMYPYVTLQIFSNFISLTRDILYIDLKEIVSKIGQKVLVVTSSKDNTAHPEGSRTLHLSLENSEFYDRQEGSHISFFEAPKDLHRIFTNFHDSCFAI